jgi:transposase
LGVHRKRGREDFEDFGVLSEYQGTLVHDGLASYQRYGCRHALCNAHHLRQLKFEQEVNRQPWAHQMSALRLEALRSEYRQLLQTAQRLNSPHPPDGSPDRTQQTSTVNLLSRLDKHQEQVLRSLSDPQAPFTNNDSEREVRMPKVKLKTMGAFRSWEGAQSFAILRACCSSLQKQRQPLLSALEGMFRGEPLPLDFSV